MDEEKMAELLRRANEVLSERPGAAEWDQAAAQWCADYRQAVGE